MQPRQVVAMMDTQDLATTLKKDEALVEEAERVLDKAKANLARRRTQVTFAKQALDRTAVLVPKGFATIEQLDQRRQQMAAAVAGQGTEIQYVWQVQHPLDAAMHDVELYRVNILDNTLVAPKEGPIEYRVANVGEVLPAGGKIFTMLDASYVYGGGSRRAWLGRAHRARCSAAFITDRKELPPGVAPGRGGARPIGRDAFRCRFWRGEADRSR